MWPKITVKACCQNIKMIFYFRILCVPAYCTFMQRVTMPSIYAAFHLPQKLDFRTGNGIKPNMWTGFICTSQKTNMDAFIVHYFKSFPKQIVCYKL